MGAQVETARAAKAEQGEERPRLSTIHHYKKPQRCDGDSRSENNQRLREESRTATSERDRATALARAATAERVAIAARVAIPSATDVTEFEQVADTSIQTLRRLGDIAGNTTAADALRRELTAAGWSMLDRKDGYSLEPLKH